MMHNISPSTVIDEFQAGWPSFCLGTHANE
jgi:hypothetical protein